MNEYKTPGVYVEDINTLPPSVAQVETSVPVFIGYTEKAINTKGESIANTPVLVQSLSEYIQYFGQTASSNPDNYCLYDSVELFYSNGGGKLYIISVGDYLSPVMLTTLSDALTLSKKITVTLIAIPDAVNLASEQEFYSLQNQMLSVCAELTDRFAVLDTRRPTGNIISDSDTFRNNITNDNLKWGAVYYPWLKLVSGKEVPPSGAICGIYAKVDSERGVWKAPANVAVNGIIALTVLVDSINADKLNIDVNNGKSINTIRYFEGKGFLVWGARTLAGNDNEWRYVSVRRFFIMIEQSVKQSTAWAVFEPNDSNTWVRIRGEIENYLFNLWRNGALQGAKTQEACYVRCGINETMTNLDILEGRLIIEIGLAVVRPAEFIILRFSHKVQVS
ncbi:MAG: phage tail sheath family protein [Sphingobacteriales bacterium]|nr:MAG: phage tail sheath family protein [Sphingobacteriales bacterium]